MSSRELDKIVSDIGKSTTMLAEIIGGIDDLKRERDAAVARREELANALREVERWANAYPYQMFSELTPEEWERAREALDQAGLSLDRVSASNMRHVVARLGAIAREALNPTEES